MQERQMNAGDNNRQNYSYFYGGHAGERTSRSTKAKAERKQKRQYGNKHEINKDIKEKHTIAACPLRGMPWAPPLSQKWPQDGAR